jgi:hypothetical protein
LWFDKKFAIRLQTCILFARLFLVLSTAMF